MQSLTISGKEYNMPDVLNDLAYGAFLAYCKAETDIDRLTALLGEPLTDLEGTPKVERQMTNALALMDAFDKEIADWLHQKGDPKDTDEITIMGKVCKFGNDLGTLPYWALTKVKAIIKEMGNEPYNQYEHYTSLVANYTYAKFKPYNEYEAETFGEEVINQLPFTSVIQLGDFFLYMQCRLWMPKISCYKLKFQLKKSRLASMFSLSMAR